MPALRDADRLVERAKLPTEAFLDDPAGPTSKGAPVAPVNKDARERALKRKQEVVDSLKNSKLMSEPCSHSITVTALNDLDGGAAMIVGTWERDTKGVNFYSATEKDLMAQWDRKWAENDAAYSASVEKWNRCAEKYPSRIPEECRADPARDRQLAVNAFNAKRDTALRAVSRAANPRQERYARIRFELRCPPELAAKVDRGGLLGKKRVSIVLQIEDVELVIASPDLPLPPVVNLIRGQVVELDPGVLSEK